MKKILLVMCLIVIGHLQSNKLEQAKNAGASVVADSNVSFQTSSALEESVELSRRLPSLGFGNIAAGRLFLSFLQHFYDISKQDRENAPERNISPAFFEAILEKDPFYKDYYLFLSSSTTLHAAQPQKTVDLMAKGLERIDPALMPNSFYIWRYKGIDELLFLGDSKAAQNSFEKAAEWAAQSDAPNSELMSLISARTANFLASDPDSKTVQISAWGSILESALNDTIRDRAAQQIRRLGGEVSFQENGAFSISHSPIEDEDADRRVR